MQKPPPWILSTIIFTQFVGTSHWFAGNAVLINLQRQWSFDSAALGYMTSAVQLGFFFGCYRINTFGHITLLRNLPVRFSGSDRLYR